MNTGSQDASSTGPGMQPTHLRSGIPSLRGVEAVLNGPLYKALLDSSDAFLKTNQNLLRRYGRHWGADPLRNWSRRWEYPFVAQRVIEHAKQHQPGRLDVLDAGSGVTFFPYYLLETLPCARVTCCDSNPAYGEMFAGINQDSDRGSVGFVSAALQQLPMEADTVDVIYCISVLEHTGDYNAILDEFCRVLRGEGMLVLTFDVSLDGKSDIQRSEAVKLLKSIGERFVVGSDPDPLEELDRLDGPEEILTTDYVRKTAPQLLPWKYPLLKAVYDLLKGRGWTGGFHSLSCYCLSVRLET